MIRRDALYGQEAIELALQRHPHVVLMDVSMPRLNGIEATRSPTAQRPGIRVIGLSMHEDDDMAMAMREAGAVAYLTKGKPPGELIATILSMAADRLPG